MAGGERAVTIRAATECDFDGIWAIFREVVAGGDSYAFPPGTPPEVARGYWLAPDAKAFVAEVDGRVAGAYKLRPNQVGLGSHVANASFMVDPRARGLGLGERLGRHCLEEARRDGYLAMQFNFVVATNAPAVRLWRRLGFDIVGTLPRAFRHATLGLVDAYVMHRTL